MAELLQNTTVGVALLLPGLLFALILGAFIYFLAAKIYIPLLNNLRTSRLDRRKDAFEKIYLDFCVDLANNYEATREFAHVSPRIGLHEVFIRLFFRDDKGDRFRLSYEYFVKGKVRKLLILGPAGSGKTSVLRHIFANAVSDYSKVEKDLDWQLPIYCTARELSSYKQDTLPALLVAHTSLLTMARPKRNYFFDSLADGRVMLMIDGFDELTSHQQAASLWKSISEWSTEYTSCRFIVTSRYPRVYGTDAPATFKKLKIEPFTDGQISEFVKKWTSQCFDDFSDVFEDPSSFQQNRLELRTLVLENSIMSNLQLKELARNPLLLTLMCTTHNFSGSLPSSRAFLYQNVVELLLSKIEIELPIHQLNYLFGQIAFAFQLKKVTQETSTLVQEIIGEFVAEMALTASVADLYSDLVDRSGLLLEPSPDQISFIHYAFQEYFAAQYITDSDLALSSLSPVLDDSWWKDVLLLAAETALNIDELCNAVLASSNLEASEKIGYIAEILNVARNITLEEKGLLLRNAVQELSDGDVDFEEHRLLLLTSGTRTIEAIRFPSSYNDE